MPHQDILVSTPAQKNESFHHTSPASSRKPLVDPIMKSPGTAQRDRGCQLLPGGRKWQEMGRFLPTLPRSGMERDAGAYGDSALLLHLGELQRVRVHFLSVTGTLQQGMVQGERASPAPDFTQQGVQGCRCAASAADTYPGTQGHCSPGGPSAPAITLATSQLLPLVIIYVW